MNLIYQALGLPLGWIMWAIYKLVRNYGLALLVFTILTRVFMFPLSIKQQKSTAKMTMLKPQLTEIQNKYKNNKEKLNEEMMKLYQKEGYNPMSGCLPLLIQMPILFGLIDVIYRPLTHILRLSKDTILVGEKVLSELTGVAVRSGINTSQLQIISGVRNNPAAYAEMGSEAIETIGTLNLNFLWMDLTAIPNLNMITGIFNTPSTFNLVIFIPILSGVTALLTSIITMKTSAATMDGAGAGSMKGMMLMMPVFSTMIAFSVPAGVGLYWIYSNICAAGQSIIMNKLYNPKEIAEKAQAEFEAKQELERQERIEAKKKQKEEGKSKLDEKAMTPKEQSRKKLSDARRRLAEKYGEEYVDDSEDN